MRDTLSEYSERELFLMIREKEQDLWARYEGKQQVSLSKKWKFSHDPSKKEAGGLKSVYKLFTFIMMRTKYSESENNRSKNAEKIGESSAVQLGKFGL